MKTTFKIGNLLFALGIATTFFFNNVKAAGVFPIATNPAREYGLSFAFDGTNYLVGIWGDEITNTAITAQLVGPTGALVGSRLKVGRTGGFPFVAFDGTNNYLLVWRDDTNSPNDDIYGQLVSRSGALVGSPFPITTDPGYQEVEPGSPVVFGAGKYLVVWRDESTGTKTVYGRLFSASGAPSSSEILISADGFAAPSASAAFDGTNFLVVWQQQTSAPQEQYDTDGVILSPSGTKGTPFTISQSTSPSYNPLSPLFNGTNYFVTWNKDVGPGYPSPTDFDVYGRLVSPAGSVLGNEIALVTGTASQVFPGLAFDGANYLLNWSEGLGSTNSLVHIQFFNPAGQAIGPSFAPFTAQGTNSPIFAAALFDGTRFAAIATLAGGDPNVKYGTSADVYGAFIPASTAQPQFSTSASYTNKQFSLSLAGTPGINYAIQMATNLVAANWTSLVTNSPTNGTFTFTDLGATNRSRFYRAVKQ